MVTMQTRIGPNDTICYTTEVSHNGNLYLPTANQYLDKDIEVRVRVYENTEVKNVQINAVNCTVYGAGPHYHESVAELYALPDESYTFKMWSDGVLDNPRWVYVEDENIELDAICDIPVSKIKYPPNENATMQLIDWGNNVYTIESAGVEPVRYLMLNPMTVIAADNNALKTQAINNGFWQPIKNAGETAHMSIKCLSSSLGPMPMLDTANIGLISFSTRRYQSNSAIDFVKAPVADFMTGETLEYEVLLDSDTYCYSMFIGPYNDFKAMFEIRFY